MGAVPHITTSVLAAASSPLTVDVQVEENDAIHWDAEHRLEQADEIVKMLEDSFRDYINPFRRVQQVDNNESGNKETLTYTIESGDTLSEISAKFDISVEEIAYVNDIANPHRISVGQELEIRVKQTPYRVRYGQDIEAIAKEAEIDVSELLAANESLNDTEARVFPGQELEVPTPEPEHIPPLMQSQVRVASYEGDTAANSAEASAKTTTEQPQTETEVHVAETTESPVGADPAHTEWHWPAQGTITSEFGMRWGRMHNGIDIANAQKSNARIQAAADGVVADASYHAGAYGNLVIIDHGNGMETYYAHLSSISVSNGQHIQQGEVLGNMGRTGNATGYHLHFEIRHHNEPVNPLHYLP